MSYICTSFLVHLAKNHRCGLDLNHFNSIESVISNIQLRLRLNNQQHHRLILNIINDHHPSSKMMKKFRNSLTKSTKKNEGTNYAPSSMNSVCHACGQQAPPSSNGMITEAPNNTYNYSPTHKQHRISWNSTSTSDSGYTSLADDNQTLCELDGGIYTMPYNPLQFRNSRSIHNSISTPASSIYSEHIDPLEVQVTTSVPVSIEINEAKHTKDFVPSQQDRYLSSSGVPAAKEHGESNDNKYLDVRPRANTGPLGSSYAPLTPDSMPRSRYARLNELPVVSPRASAFSPDVFERMEVEARNGAAGLAQEDVEPAEKESRRWHKRATLSVGILPSQLRRLSLGRASKE